MENILEKCVWCDGSERLTDGVKEVIFKRARWRLKEVSKDNGFEAVVCVGGRCIHCRPGGDCVLCPISLVAKVSEDSDEASVG